MCYMIQTRIIHPDAWADGRGEFVATAGAETPKAMAMPGQWSCREREPTMQTGMGRSSLEGRSRRESPEGG